VRRLQLKLLRRRRQSLRTSSHRLRRQKLVKQKRLRKRHLQHHRRQNRNRRVLQPQNLLLRLSLLPHLRPRRRSLPSQSQREMVVQRQTN
jgi:hypothetical protein